MNPGPAAAPLVIRAKPGLAAFKPALPTQRGPQPDEPRIAGVAARRAGASGSRDRLLPERSRHALVQPVSRLHRVASRRQALLQRRPRGQPRVESVGEDPRYRRGAEGRDAQGRRDQEAGSRSRRAGPSRHRGGRDFVPGRAEGQSTRLRIAETYTDPGRYLLEGEELVWDRAFGRPRNSVVLPAGWTVVASSIPAAISEDADGRQRLYFENARPDEIQTLIRARRIVGGGVKSADAPLTTTRQ